MRLHQLEVTAFGPFADTVEVDFDELSAGGLFLLTGPTGAGKTSILDAVCFALYGDVPGDRSTAKRLRSDHAAPATAPQVRLECTLAGRRFRLVRSPAWARPKKRGQGTTPQQATVSVSELVAGRWEPLTSRLDEAGQLVSGLTGMTLSQFTQVALLPQGRFQSFLRARSEERHRLLQQVFRTGRFEEVERWLRDHRLEQARASREHEQRIDGLLNRVSEAAGAGTPPSWQDPGGLSLAADGSEVTAWARTVTVAADTARDMARAQAETARIRAEGARRRHEAALRLMDEQRRFEDAIGRLGELRALAPEHDRLRMRVDAARRAVAVPSLEQARAAAESAVAESVELAARTAREAREAPTAWTGDLESTREQALLAAARVEAALPGEARLSALSQRVARTEAELDRRRTEREELEETIGRAPREVALLRQQVDEARTAGLLLPAAEKELEAATSRQSAARRLTGLAGRLEQARTGQEAAQVRLHAAKAALEELQERRIAGIAGELARALAVGASCPVCGSAEHPHPAATGSAAPTAAAHKRARSAVDDAEAELTVHDAAVRDADTALALARQMAGPDSPEVTETEVEEARAERDRLQALAQAEGGLAAALTGLEQSLQQALDRRDGVRADLTELEAELRAARTESEQLSRDIAGMLDGSGAATLSELWDRHRASARRCAEATRAAAAASADAAALEAARSQLASACDAAGFDTVELALAAALTRDEVEAIQDRLRDHDAEVAAQSAVVAEPALILANQSPVPDLEALAGAADAADQEAAARQGEALQAEATARRLGELEGELCVALEEWAPVRAALSVATRVAGLAEGKSADNRWAMRLSAYVLAYRLRQVVGAANARLGRMSDSRYALEHTAQRGAGETRGGLSLVVCDTWSGEARDPATLSGGETFVVSLALALGLADVICGEAGGVQLDTLFVDEGFGALDSDTLEDVLDTLDSLREGGRVVGLVSHLPQLRERIPAQLTVDKGRSGSCLRRGVV